MTSRRLLPILYLLLMPLSTFAEEEISVLTIERLFGAPDLDGPGAERLKFSPDSGRVTFLRGKADDPLQTDLWEYDIATGRSAVLVDSTDLTGGAERLSDEERARRERLRIVGKKGIVDYHFAPDGSRLLFPLNGDLYLYDLQDREGRWLIRTEAAESDPKFSPDGRFVSFVRGQNLYIVDIQSGQELPVTTDGGGLIHNGVAEFVAQEEMDRYTGYWWSPDSKAIAFTRFDESPVRVARRFEINAEDVEVFDQRYPATGTPNVWIEVGVFSLEEQSVRWMDLGDSRDIYVARVDWFPDGRHLAIQRQQRDQKTLDLLKADIRSGQTQVVLNETSDSWIDLHNDLVFLEDSLRFIWSSARNGFAHLYLYENDGKLLRPLTEGEWEVANSGRGTSSIVQVDEREGIVYFTATKDSPLERQLYSVSLENPAEITRITGDAGRHRVEFSGNGAFFIDRFNNVDTPPRVALHRADGSRIAYIEENRLDESHPYFPFLATRPSTRFGKLKAEDGQALHYRMLLPADFDAARAYPVIVYVYGGPQGQQVVNAWSVGFPEILARNGFLVFTLDNRGTGFRGTAFDAPIYRRLGSVEVRDQMVGVGYLRSLPYVDNERIGIYGWSYGGYMALMSLFTQPETFAAGISGAPVTDWTLYDTHYTERYLGTPQENPGGYEASSVFPYVDNLEKPLLIMHGMADDNVLFTNSTKLFKALQDAQKDFDMMTYPGSKHSLLRVPAAGMHGYAKMLDFFREHLRIAVP